MVRYHGFVGFIGIAAGIIWSGTAQAQPGSVTIQPIGMVAMEPVQKEIGLEGQALAEVKNIISSFRDEYRSEIEKAGLPGPGGLQKLSEEDRNAAARKRRGVMQKLNEKFLPQLKAALTPAQFVRLQQIEWQFGGSQALTDPELGKLLDLTKEQ
jgi:hypothetical protein